MKILLIDDEIKILRLLQFNLDNSGHSTIAINDPKIALEVASQEKPDVIIMDLMMPDIDGLKLTKLIRENHCTSKIPIIILSAKAQHGEILDTYKFSKIDYYITKPFTLEQISRGLELVV